jgi:hypothetical protein
MVFAQRKRTSFALVIFVEQISVFLPRFIINTFGQDRNATFKSNLGRQRNQELASVEAKQSSESIFAKLKSPNERESQSSPKKKRNLKCRVKLIKKRQNSQTEM